MGKILRGESLAELIVRLERLERHKASPVKLSKNAAEPEKAIWAAGDGLRFGGRPEKLSKAMMAYLYEAIRARRFKSPFWAGLYPAKLKTRSKADTVKVKNSLLAFYPEDGVLAKLSRASGVRSVNDLQNEHFVLRELASEIPGIAPKPLVFDPDTRALWMEFFRPSPMSKQQEEKAQTRFLQKLFQVYETFGLSSVKLGLAEPVNLGEFTADQFLQMANISRDDLQTLLSRAGDLNVIHSRMHGDAHSNNLLFLGEDRNETEWVICDWELSRLGPVEFDVNSLYMQKQQSEVLEIYASWAKSHGFGLNVGATVAACGIIRNLRWLSDFERFQAARGHVGVSKRWLASSLRDFKQQTEMLRDFLS